MTTFTSFTLYTAALGTGQSDIRFVNPNPNPTPKPHQMQQHMKGTGAAAAQSGDY